MPKIVKLYLTDNQHVHRMLQGKLQLQLKDGIYGKLDTSELTRLLYFDKETVLEKSVSKDPAYITLKKFESAPGVQYYNVFEPSRGGAVRFDTLSKKAHLLGRDVRRCDLMTSDLRMDDSYASDTESLDAISFALRRWTCNIMSTAYTQCYQKCGVDICYDPYIFPLLSAIAEQQDANLALPLAAKKKKNPKKPGAYSYLELYCELDGQISQADLTEILFDFYAAGVISWPMAMGTGITDSLSERILALDSLTDTPWQEQGARYQYRDLPARLWKYERNQCGIWVLDAPNFCDMYNGIRHEKQKLVLDILIGRQLSLYVPEEAGETAPDAESMQQMLHTADSLVRLLRIHAAGSQEDITDIMRKLSTCRYVSKEGKGYLVREKDKELLRYIPEHLCSMDLYSRIYKGAMAVERGRISAGAYKESVDRALRQDIAEFEKQITAQKKGDMR